MCTPKEATIINLPLFIGVGATKSGTTWTFEQLRKHPQILTSRQKETHFFRKSGNVNRFIRSNFNLADLTDRHKIMGEFDPTYFSNHASMRKLSRIPNLITLLIVRNPIERVFSIWKYRTLARHNVIGVEYLDWLRERSGMADSHKFIKRWMNYTDCKLLFYDDLIADPLAYIQNVFSILGVRKNFVPPNYKKWEVKPYNLYYAKMPRNMRKPELKATRLFFEEQIIEMSKMFNKNLDHWFLPDR